MNCISSLTLLAIVGGVSTPGLANEWESPMDWLEVPPEVIEDSPVWQRWIEAVPDVRSQIRQDPSFRSRLRLGYAQMGSGDAAPGWAIGVEDVFLGDTGFTLSADYQAAFARDDYESYGAELRYYLLPLGDRVNVAPVLGYRQQTGDRDDTAGINLGVRVLFALSRTGAADLALSQTWVSPGTESELGLTTLSTGYALTDDLRLSIQLQRQNTQSSHDTRVGMGLEWMF